MWVDVQVKYLLQAAVPCLAAMNAPLEAPLHRQHPSLATL
jgi:hypothetical protein